ncbi:hypothetical protein [Streptomyces aureus]|uniref:hypothetical protein n=1 Tax=Streptomyces aureus TaxID=193461 RepID=UPI0034040B5B
MLTEQSERAADSTDLADPRWERAEDLDRIEGEIRQLIEAERSGSISVATLLQLLPPKERIRDELKLERARFHKDVRQHRNRENAANLTAEDFFSFAIERQQEVILHSLTAMLIHPADRGRRIFNPALIEPVWR